MKNISVLPPSHWDQVRKCTYAHLGREFDKIEKTILKQIPQPKKTFDAWENITMKWVYILRREPKNNIQFPNQNISKSNSSYVFLNTTC
jgi:hypothetical protein